MIFSQSTGRDISNEETMSCDDKTPAMPPVALRPSSSRQTLHGTVLCQVLTQQPSLTLLPLQTPQILQTSKTPTRMGWTSVLEWLFEEVPS